MFDEAELGDEEEIVFVAGVDVCLRPHAADNIEVVDVDVDEDAEQPA